MEIASDEQRMIPITSYADGKTTTVGWLRTMRRVVGATTAAVVVGVPLLAVMGITMGVTLSLTVIGFPIMVLCSPLLVIPTFILVTCIAGFSLAAVMALAGISTLNWVFRSIRHRFYIHGKPEYTTDYDDDKTVMTTEEEKEAAATDAFAENLHKKQQSRDEETAVNKNEDKDSGDGDGDGDGERDSFDKPKDGETSSTTATDTDTTEKKQQVQKVKKTKTPKKK